MSTGPTERTGPLQTVDRALDVLLSFDEYRTSWGVMELAEEFGLARSTAQRLLASLAGKGFLRADPDTRRYGMGPAMWRMAGLWERSGGLSALAEPLLAELARASGRTSLFCVPDGAHVRCIAAVSGSEGPRRSHPFVDELYPAHAGATSRAYFAFLDPAERRALLAGRPSARFSDLTPFDEREVEELFDTAVEEGYAISQGEYDAASRALAVPVFGGKRPVGSVSLVENKHSDHDDDLLDHLAPLRASADELTGLLSNRRPAPPTRRWRRGHGSRPSPRPTTP
ncbi:MULTISPECIES: IclR family transcriptional regulator [Nocardiopsidaceae]|uniref:IclR family transcriptional regulator n=1 Tax=Streptomonospora nanhaiensis TaxID=1323731 RepID=A0ABY6YTQ3_9ACTN|nr:IclR family transcriptional regulator [Streptomonospora nanhaiensis]WAE75736.1 IclR family transcriptional regulator [Streptomonospora nanhaiensis]